MPRFLYFGTKVANNVAGHTWLPGDANDVLDEDAYMLRGLPDVWADISEPATPRMQAVSRMLALGKMPVDMVVFGDSTADTSAEWFYRMGLLASTGIAKNHSVAYRAWNDSSQQFSPGSSSYISTGPLGRRYVLSGSQSTAHRIELTDSAKLHTPGDLDIRALVNLNGGTFSAAFSVVSKYGGAGQRSWRFEVTTGNNLFLDHTADGTTQITRSSSVALSGTQLTDDIWIRVTLDVNNGSGGNEAKFYTSTDGSNWTQLGTTSTIASTTSVFDSTTSLQFMGRGGSPISSIGKDVRFYEAQVFGSLDGTNLMAWIDAGSVPPRTSATSSVYYDDMGNVGTITYASSTVVGSPRLCLFSASVGGQTLSYSYDAARFVMQSGGALNVAFINYSHNETTTVAYRTPLKALTDLIVAKNPMCAIVGVLQNKRISPATYIEEHEIRIGVMAQYMAEIGGDVLDFFGIVNAADMKADGVHPDDANASVMAKMAAAAYGLLERNGARWRNPS